MSTRIDLGHFALGSSRTFTFIFKQNGTPANPAVAPVLNVTLNGVETTKTLTHGSTGTYTWTPLFTVAGLYSATVYAPEGNGETSQPFVFVIDPDVNYP